MLSPSISSEIRTCPPMGILSEGMHAERTAFQVLLERLQAGNAHVVPLATAAAMLDDPDDRSPVEWSEEDIVLLHWRLLKEIGRLADPETPLEEKFDTLRWVFTERERIASHSASSPAFAWWAAALCRPCRIAAWSTSRKSGTSSAVPCAAGFAKP